MTVLTVASSLFTIPSGKMQIGDDIDLSVVTIGQVKALLQDEFGPCVCPLERQRFFWHGYLLDDRMNFLDACVGVKEGERVKRDEESLTIFLTVDKEPDDDNDEVDIYENRSRNNSFEARLKQRRETCAMS